MPKKKGKGGEKPQKKPEEKKPEEEVPDEERERDLFLNQIQYLADQLER